MYPRSQCLVPGRTRVNESAKRLNRRGFVLVTESCLMSVNCHNKAGVLERAVMMMLDVCVRAYECVFLFYGKKLDFFLKLLKKTNIKYL